MLSCLGTWSSPKSSRRMRLTLTFGPCRKTRWFLIGPETVADIKELFCNLRTLFWDGPVGAFEIEPFGRGTFALAKTAARLTQAGKLLTVAGGGDTLAAFAAADVTDSFSHVSTAGGAFLEWLEGRDLPGVAILRTFNI
ncbi:MAG: phosphoglycerate kinase [Bradyrhizobium sp.]